MEWLTVQDAANYLKLRVPTIRKYIRLNKLPCHRQGRIIRFKKEDLDNFLGSAN